MRFSFGKNWQSYTDKALDPAKLEQAKMDFGKLCSGIELEGRSFLDIGFGQGLSLCIAREMGADVLGIDVDADNVKALEKTSEAFGFDEPPPVLIGSIVDDEFLDSKLGNRSFDVVHSWGVLHHTGNMESAIKNAARLTADGGWLVIAIYNRHWSSPIWRIIKWLYNLSPGLVKRIIIWKFYAVIYAAKWLVTGKNPKKKNRGMDFYHDVIDWVGGYPYEYADSEEVVDMMVELGFECVNVFPAKVPTGCNEFVFQRKLPSAESG